MPLELSSDHTFRVRYGEPISQKWDFSRWKVPLFTNLSINGNTLGPHIVLGFVILAIYLFHANLILKTVLATKVAQAKLLAATARIVTLVLAYAMALRQMGVANETINMAFCSPLEAIAIAHGFIRRGSVFYAWSWVCKTPAGSYLKSYLSARDMYLFLHFRKWRVIQRPYQHSSHFPNHSC